MSRPLTSVAAVKAALRGWQNYHMDDLGWSDLGYQVGVDQAGNRYELRGLSAQSGANGDQDVNERFGACLLILAPGEQPSDAMVNEVRSVVADHRTLFPRSTKIVGHTDIRPEPTACPGPAALAAIRAGTFDPATEEITVTPVDFLRYKLFGKKQGNRTVADVLREDNANLRRIAEAVDRLEKRPPCNCAGSDTPEAPKA